MRFGILNGGFFTRFGKLISICKPLPKFVPNELPGVLISGLGGKESKLRHLRPTGMISFSSYSVSHTSVKQSCFKIYKISFLEDNISFRSEYTFQWS